MSRKRQPRPKYSPPPKPEVVWCVFGVDQHGEEIYFDEITAEGAEGQAERLSRLGGSVIVRKMFWNSPAAAYRPVRNPSDSTNERSE